MRNNKENLIIRLTFDFALRIIAFSEEIRQMNRFENGFTNFQKRNINWKLKPISGKPKMPKAKQILFINLKFLTKEADELNYWLELCSKSEFYPNPKEELLKELHSINLIISKIISSSKKH